MYKKIAVSSAVLCLALNIFITTASAQKSTAEIVAQVTNQSVEDVEKQFFEGVNYFKIVKNAGKIKEFKEAKLTDIMDTLNKLVESGKITKDESEKYYNNAKNMMENHNGKAHRKNECNSEKNND